MSGSVKLGIIIILAVVVGGIVLKLITGILGSLLGILAPLAVVAGIGLIIYGLVSRRPLPGSRRYLP